MEELYEKITDFIFSISKKLDQMSQNIFEQTGKKINFKLIILAVVLGIFTLIVVKSILGWVASSL